MTTFFQQTAQAMIAKHIDRFPLLKLDQVIDWQPIEQYLSRQSKDSDARWIKKNGLYKLGYKQHTRTDEEGYSGLNLNQDKATKP